MPVPIRPGASSQWRIGYTLVLSLPDDRGIPDVGSWEEVAWPVHTKYFIWGLSSVFIQVLFFFFSGRREGEETEPEQ